MMQPQRKRSGDHALERAGRSGALLLIVIVSFATGGCALGGAPSFILFGAYFPAWMLVALIGVVLAAVTRVVLLATGLASVLPFQLFVCASVGLIGAVLVWLVGFAR